MRICPTAGRAGKLVDVFDPVVRHIREKCLSSTFTALDATRLPVLDPLPPRGIKSGSLWLIEGDHTYACFLYEPSAHAEHLKAFFDGRTLQKRDVRRLAHQQLRGEASKRSSRRM
jgi:hypothetical protein